MKNRLLIVFLLVSLYSFSQTYTQGRKNWSITAEGGTVNPSNKLLSDFENYTGISYGLSVGKYISFKRTGVLPLSVRFQYNYLDFSKAQPSGRRLSEHHFAVPIQFDIALMGLKLSKSKHYECRYLNSGISFGIVPTYRYSRFISSELNMPLELAYFFNIEKSGGHKSVVGKKILFYVFARVDLKNSKNSDWNGAYPRLNTFGLRMQYTHFKTYKFSNM